MKNKISRNFLVALACCAIYFFVSEPFRFFFRVSFITEVRPASAFPVIFGMAFGFWGTFGCAVGNLFADIHSGYNWVLMTFGFVFQLLYGYLPVIVWNWWRRNEDNKFRLDKIFKIIQYLLLMIADSVFITLLIFTLLFAMYKTPILCLASVNTFFNQIIFFIIIGIPFLIGCSIWKQKMANKASEKKIILFSMNEKFILFALLSSIAVSIGASIFSYFIFHQKFVDDPMKLWSYTYFTCGSCLLICLCPNLIFLRYLEQSITTPLERMSHIGSNFGQESEINLEIEKIFMRSNKYLSYSSEIGSLARSYSALGTQLGNYVRNLTTATAEKEKNETQLKIASEIQEGALPKKIDIPNVELHASMNPALEVGGDFYDFFMVDENHLAMLIADVSGKGVPAALFMMESKIILRNNLKDGLSPADALSKTNQELTENNSADMFVTVLCMILNLETKVLTLSSAGHDKPLICKKDGSFEFVDIKNGFVLGGMSGMKYKNFDVQLSEGDTVFAYTDGIPESMNRQNQEFGNERMIKHLNVFKEKSVEEICENLKISVSLFTNSATQFDDITMLVFRLREDITKTKCKFDINKTELLDVKNFIENWCEQNSVESKIKNKIGICADEILSNIIFYSYANFVEVFCDKSKDEISIKFIDDGTAFNPFEQINEPDINADVEERNPGGLGFFMVKKMMKNVDYKRENNFNVMEIKI